MYDIAIIGAGPGGYTAAIRASQLGAKVALIEKENLGGTCLNWGCIPSKALLSSADKFAEFKKLSKYGINIENPTYDYSAIFKRKNQIVEKIIKNLSNLLNSNDIDIHYGTASIVDDNTLDIEGMKLKFKNLILATGSRPSSIQGLEYDHEFIIDSNDILEQKELPESILIVGSGAIGIEWARIFSNLGKKVFLIEIAPQLAPAFDVDISKRIERLLKKQRVEFYKETTVEKINGKIITLSNGKEIAPGKVLIAAGRTPCLENIKLENLSIEKDGIFIKVDDNLCTNIPNVYAIGDITGKIQLAHTASHQAVAVAEYIMKAKQAHINYNQIPSVIYGKPEIASVGQTEQQLLDKNIEYKISLVPLTVTGKAIVDDELDGFVKILSSEDKILGAHIIANEASSMIQQLTIAMGANIGLEQIKEIVFAHPTISESIHEAVLNIDNEAIHIPKSLR